MYGISPTDLCVALFELTTPCTPEILDCTPEGVVLIILLLKLCAPILAQVSVLLSITKGVVLYPYPGSKLPFTSPWNV